MRIVLTLSLLVLSVCTPALADDFKWNLHQAPGTVGVEALPPNSTFTALLNVTSDRDENVYDLGLLSDAKGAPLGLALLQHGRPTSSATPYLFSAIASTSGVTLFETEGRQVLLLQGALNSTRSGGRFHLRYLTNGLFMSYSTCDLLLKSQGGNYWAENAYTGGKITAVKIVTSTFGVSTLEGVCPAR